MFGKFLAHYGQRWAHQCDPETIEAKKYAWLDALLRAEVNRDDLAMGTHRAVAISDWPPSTAELIKLSRKTPEDRGWPPAEEAFRQAMECLHPSNHGRWHHEAVRLAARNVPRLSEMDANAAWKAFEAAYRRLAHNTPGNLAVLPQQPQHQKLNGRTCATVPSGRNYEQFLAAKKQLLENSNTKHK